MIEVFSIRSSRNSMRKHIENNRDFLSHMGNGTQGWVSLILVRELSEKP